MYQTNTDKALAKLNETPYFDFLNIWHFWMVMYRKLYCAKRKEKRSLPINKF